MHFKEQLFVDLNSLPQKEKQQNMSYLKSVIGLIYNKVLL